MSKIYLLIIIGIFSRFTFAQNDPIRPIILDSYGCNQNSLVCKAINDNLDRDSNGCRMYPDSIGYLESFIKQKNPSLTQIQVFDRIRYFGPVSGKYSYDYQRQKNGKFHVTAKVFFKNLNEYSPAEIQILNTKFKKAAQIWNQSNPFKNTYQFEFLLASQNSTKTVSANLVRFNTRGPYFDKWSFNWNEYVIAHEFGHVLGLFDEYDYMKGTSDPADCDQSSIMCNSYGEPKPYHYHLILQRSFCEV